MTGAYAQICYALARDGAGSIQSPALARVPRGGALLEVLFALLIAVELVQSALLERAVIASVSRFRSARTFTFALVLATGVLAMLVTNDVALFVVIPFTVLAKRYSDFEVRSAVVLEVISANVLGCLTRPSRGPSL